MTRTLRPESGYKNSNPNIHHQLQLQMPKKPAYLESRVISFSGLKCSSGARIPALSAPMLGLLCLAFLRLASSAGMASVLGSFVCNSTAINGYLPVGTGLCADAAGRRTSGHYCWGPACPDFTPASCASACDGTPGCTGFVLQNCRYAPVHGH